MTTDDHKKPGCLFADLDQTPQPGLPENLDINNLWIIFRIVYGRYTITKGQRAGFNKLNDDALGYALYHVGTLP